MRIFIRKIIPPVYIWMFFRLLNSLNALLFSIARPITSIEKEVAIWPPFPEMGVWFNRVFLAPWFRWDAVVYANILTSGYIAGDGSTSFHPLYILLSTPLYLLGFSPLFSLLITSSLAALGFFWIFYKLACMSLDSEKSVLALLLFATFPVSMILFAAYTESIFLFFSTLALYQMRKRNWWFTALATFLASLARQQGIFLAFPILWYVWEDAGRSLSGLMKNWRGWMALCSAPSGLLIWAIYRICYLHEGVLDWHNLQGFVYSALLSPSAKKIFPDQAIMWPWDVFLISVPKLMHAPDIGDVMTFALGIGFLVIFSMSWKSMNIAERIYCLVITFISFSMSTGSFRIYLSLPRHLFIAVPVFIGLSASLKQRWQQITIIGLQLLLQTFMLFLYITKSWIP